MSVFAPFFNAVNTYTNLGASTNGGTGYYTTGLNGMKLCWGQTGNFSITGSASVTLSLPASFFSTVQAATITPFNTNVAVAPNAIGTGAISIFLNGTTASSAIIWYVVGT